MTAESDRDRKPKGSATAALLGLAIVALGGWMVYDPELFMPGHTTFPIDFNGSKYVIDAQTFKNLSGLIVLFGAAIFYRSGRTNIF